MPDRLIREVDAASRASEGRLAGIVSMVPDAVVSLDHDQRITLFNPAAERMFGYAVDEVLGQSLDVLIPPSARPAHRTAVLAFGRSAEAARRMGDPRRVTGLRKGGEAFPAECFISLQVTNGTLHYTAVVRDLTDQRRTEEELQRTSRALRTLSTCNEALVRAADETSLFAEVCRAIVEIGGYRLAWVGQAIADRGKHVRPLAWAGDGADYVQHADVRWSNTKRGHGPTGRAIRERSVQIARNILTDPTFEPWRSDALARGYAASLALPLIVDGALPGALMVYSADPAAFDREEVDLMIKLADDLAYGVGALRARAAMERSAAGLKEAQAIAHVGSWELDLVSDVLTWSEETYRIFGLDPGAFGASYEAFLGCIHPDDREAVNKAYTESVATRAPYAVDHRLLLGDGRVKVVHEQGRTFYDADGRPLRSVGTVQDITERTRVEDAQRAASRYSRNLLEASLDPLVTISPVGTITDVNKATEEVTGVPRGDLIGTDFADYFTEPAQARAGYRRVLSEESVRDYPLTIRHRDGHTTDVLYNAAVYRDEGAEVQGVFAAARDITDRKRAEAALRESEERLRLAMDGAQAGMWDWRVPSDELVFSSRCKELFGLPPHQEMRYAVFEGALHPDDRVRVRQVVEGSWRRHEDYRTEYRAVWPDGSVHWLAAMGRSIYDAAGEVERMMGIVIDIDDRKRAEEEVRQLNEDLERRVEERTAQLEAANRELEAFSYSVSHDLRAPLRSMDGFSQAILDDYAGQLDERGARYLDRIQAASQRMGMLIDDLLKLARLSRTEMRVEDVNVSALVQEIAHELERGAPDRDVEWCITPDLHASGDSRLLRVALENLLGNAWKFTAPHTGARIEFGTGMAPTGEPAFFVRDDGVGFDTAYADKLFGAFQRLHGATEFEGSGIGLATVERVVRRHGGQVWAEGAVEQGACFYFSLGVGGL